LVFTSHINREFLLISIDKDGAMLASVPVHTDDLFYTIWFIIIRLESLIQIVRIIVGKRHAKGLDGLTNGTEWHLGKDDLCDGLDEFQFLF
jgi:hypothetical protein